MQRFLLLTLLMSATLFAAAQDSSNTNLTGMSLEDLMSIKVVSSTGTPQTVADAPSTIRVITSQQIQDRGYENIADVMRDVAGVDVIHTGGYYPDVVYFRGLYGAENLRALFLIDGVRENNLAGSPDLFGPAYPLHNVERIEIIWGPASAIYGADALGGVVNIITKKGAEMSGLHYEKVFGSNNTQAEYASFGMKKRNVDVAMAGSLYSTDGPRYPDRDPFYHGAFVDKAWSFNTSITHTLGRFKTSLNYRTYDTPMSFGNIIPSATKILKLPAQAHNNSGAIGVLQEDVRNEHASLYEPLSSAAFLTESFAASAKLNITADLIYRESGTSDRSYLYLSIDTFPLINTNGDTTKNLDTAHIYRAPIFSWSNRARGDVKASYIINDNQSVYAGVDFAQDNLEKANRGTVPDTNLYVIDGIPLRNIYTHYLARKYHIRNNLGAYAQYSLLTTLFHKTAFTAGVRYDKNTDFDSPVSPRLGIVINPREKYTIKLLYGNAFRSPKIQETAALGNKIEKPEQVNTYEVNFIYQPSAKCIVQLNAFQNNLSDIFVVNSLTGGGFQAKQSKGTEQVNGAELQLDLIQGGQFSGFANFTYQHGTQKDTSTTFDVPALPEFTGNIGLTYSIADYLTVTAIGNWVGDRKLPHTDPYGANKGYVLSGYELVNLVFTTRKFFENRVSASLNIQNIFNEGFLDPGVRTADGGLYSTVLEQPGRWMLFKISVNL